jgi:hypothetical protein
MKVLAWFLLLIFSIILFNNCVHTPKEEERRLTLGLVQKYIKKGLSQVEVGEILGAPNIVCKDKDGYETWIYDKVSSEASTSHAGASIGIVSVGKSESTASQSTLTVIIKFDENYRVLEYSYHRSKF